MILLTILEHDLHRSREKVQAIPWMVEEPVPKQTGKSIISHYKGHFQVSPGPTKESRLRVGIFDQDPDRMDDLLDPLFKAALKLSRDEGWGNVFTGPDAQEQAFKYIRKASGLPGQPFMCLCPQSWSDKAFKAYFGHEPDVIVKYKDYCRVVQAKVPCPIFLSRPDMVGKCTQIVGGKSAIFLHNVKLGIAFCPKK